MYLFYIDESGNEDDPADRHFVLGGTAVFERVSFFLAKAFDDQFHFTLQPFVLEGTFGERLIKPNAQKFLRTSLMR